MLAAFFIRAIKTPEMSVNIYLPYYTVNNPEDTHRQQ
jgi:hypothetical protein